MQNAIASLGKNTISFFHEAGAIFILLGKILSYTGRLWKDRDLLIEQMITCSSNR